MYWTWVDGGDNADVNGVELAVNGGKAVSANRFDNESGGSCGPGRAAEVVVRDIHL